MNHSKPLRVQFSSRLTAYAAGTDDDAGPLICTALALPWNSVSSNGSGRWSFQAGSVTWPADVSQIKVQADHDMRARAMPASLEHQTRSHDHLPAERR